MVQSAPPNVMVDSNWAKIEQEVRGQVIVGNKNLQIGSIHGGIVNFYSEEQQPRLQPKPTPIFIQPRRIEGMLDRTNEQRQTQASLLVNRPLEFYGPAGVGKTTLLRYLARHPMTEHFRDGVVFLSGRNQAPDDLLQSIFDVFFEYSANYKPSQGEMRQAFQDIQALILVDDVVLDRSELEILLDSAPECIFLLASNERRLWGAGDALPLGGLPEEDGMQLLARQLGRPLAAQEIEPARALCQAVAGYPLYLIQAAALVRDNGYPLDAFVQMLNMDAPGPLLADKSLQKASMEERRLLAAIGALNGEPLHGKHLSSLARIDDVKPVVKGLLERGLIQAHSPKYTVSGELGAVMEKQGELDRWRNWALYYFQHWTEAHQNQPGQLLEETAPLLRMVEWALDTGQAEKALKIARTVEEYLPLSRRWDLWQRFLQAILQAAQALKDYPATAWAMHQIGTRAMCLGQDHIARPYLIRAYRMRQSLGDLDGAAVSRHNLDLLLSPPSDPGDDSPEPPSNGGPGAGTPKGVLSWSTVLVLGTLGLIAVLLFPPSLRGLGALLSAAPTASQPVALTEVFTPSMTPTQTITAFAPGIDVNSDTVTDTPIPPADTATPTLTPSPTVRPPTPIPCTPRTGWPFYIVRRGDTLWSIGQATGASVRELTTANCKTNTTIITGESLRVPRLPPQPPTKTYTPTPTHTPSPTPTDTPTEPPPPTLLPDIVANLEVGEPELARDGSIHASFTVTVANRGESAAEPFQTAVLVSISNSQAPSTAVFDAPSLPAGGQTSFSDRLFFGPEYQGATIEVYTLADYCAPDSGQPSACRVSESNENNNGAGPVKRTLPQQPNRSPEVGIEVPSDGMELTFVERDHRGWFAIIGAYGYANDPEDGQLSGDALVWSDTGTGEVLGTGMEARLVMYSAECVKTTRKIMLTATDSQGAASAISRRVLIYPGEACIASDPIATPTQESILLDGGLQGRGDLVALLVTAVSIP